MERCGFAFGLLVSPGGVVLKLAGGARWGGELGQNDQTGGGRLGRDGLWDAQDTRAGNEGCICTVQHWG